MMLQVRADSRMTVCFIVMLWTIQRDVYGREAAAAAAASSEPRSFSFYGTKQCECVNDEVDHAADIKLYVIRDD